MSEVTDALNALHVGKKTLGEVTVTFVGRTWPTRPKTSDALQRSWSADGDDSDGVLLPGSWEEVSAAALNGIITGAQYAALFKAVHGTPTGVPAAT